MLDIQLDVLIITVTGKFLNVLARNSGAPALGGGSWTILPTVAPPGESGGSFPLWVDVQKLCIMCMLSLSRNFFVSHDKYIARPSSKEPR